MDHLLSDAKAIHIYKAIPKAINREKAPACLILISKVYYK